MLINSNRFFPSAASPYFDQVKAQTSTQAGWVRGIHQIVHFSSTCWICHRQGWRVCECISSTYCQKHFDPTRWNPARKVAVTQRWQSRNIWHLQIYHFHICWLTSTFAWYVYIVNKIFSDFIVYCTYWMSIFWIGYKMPQQFLKHHMAGTGRFFRHFQFRALSLSRVEGHWPHAEILSVGNNLTNNDLIKIRKWTIWT